MELHPKRGERTRQQPQSITIETPEELQIVAIGFNEELFTTKLLDYPGYTFADQLATLLPDSLYGWVSDRLENRLYKSMAKHDPDLEFKEDVIRQNGDRAAERYEGRSSDFAPIVFTDKQAELVARAIMRATGNVLRAGGAQKAGELQAELFEYSSPAQTERSQEQAPS